MEATPGENHGSNRVRAFVSIRVANDTVAVLADPAQLLPQKDSFDRGWTWNCLTLLSSEAEQGPVKCRAERNLLQ